MNYRIPVLIIFCCILISAVKIYDFNNLAEDKAFGRAISYNDGHLAVGAHKKVVLFKEQDGTFVSTQKIHGREGYGGHYTFGHSLSIKKNLLAVGERGHTSVSIYKFNGDEWALDTTIYGGGTFGHIVSMTNEFLFVGDPEYKNDNGGAVFVYKNTGDEWTQFQKIVAKDREKFDRFGWSLDTQDNKLVIGAYQDTENGGWSGSAYIYYFDGSNWVEEQKIIASDGVEGDRFGYSVSLNKDQLMVGAFTAFEDQSGAAYIFSYDGESWEEIRKLTPPDPANMGNYGHSVAINELYAVSGAPYNLHEGTSTGAAYIYKKSAENWDLQKKVYPADGDRLDSFGNAVFIVDSLLMIGSPHQSVGNLYLYRYENDNWSFAQELLGGTYVSNEEKDSRRLNSFSLQQNYPNPFNPTTNINFDIVKPGYVELKVYNSQGKLISNLINEYKLAGKYTVNFDGDGLPSGAYFYRLETENFSETRKMLLIK